MSEVFNSALELLSEQGARGHKQLAEELIAMRGSVKQAMDKGLSSAEMEVASAVAEAIDAAGTAVDKIYNKVTGQ